MQDKASFWTDIKNLEERLAVSPESYCFARLSDVYLKVGLVDDALYVARQGVMKHPRYLSGHRALSQACRAKGLNEEALAALQLVTAALPEDVPSQKLLGRLLAEAGDKDNASRVFRTALEFAPDDVECRIELESLGRSAGVTESTHDPDGCDEEIIEDLEMLEEIDVLEEDRPEAEFPFQEASSDSNIFAAPHYDPLSTGTLAELYVTQGYIHKALEIYRAILAENPEDRVMLARIVELEAMEAGAPVPASENDDTDSEEGEDEDVIAVPSEAFFQEDEPELLPEPSLPDVAPLLENLQTFEEVTRHECQTPAVPPQGVADNALATLDGWLENIRRIKSCR